MWTQECEEAFQRLNALLCANPVLRSPDLGKEFILQTDASEFGVGGVLSQIDNTGSDQPVAYYSKKLLPREQRHSTIEKKCLAIKLATQAFQVYLLGRPFVIQTNHRALEWLDKLRENNAKLSRWSLALQPFQIQVQHWPGKENGNADSLSRSTTKHILLRRRVRGCDRLGTQRIVHCTWAVRLILLRRPHLRVSRPILRMCIYVPA